MTPNTEISDQELPSSNTPPSTSFDEVDFFEYIAQRGYAPRQLRKLRYGLKYLQTITPLEALIPKISSRKFVTEIGEILRKEFSRDIAKTALTSAHRFRDYLIDRGIIEDSLMFRTSGYFGDVEKGIHRYICEEKNYCKQHAERIVREYEFFTNYLTSVGKDNFADINQSHIFDYYAKQKKGRTTAVTLRIILKFLFREGYLSADYSPLILCSRAKDSEVRKFLSAGDIEKLLSAIDRDTVRGKREYVFFILMARLAMRGREILRLKIDDIDWNQSRIFIRGKHERLTTLPFSKEVGDALFDYLKHSRRTDDDHLIVSLKPPFDGLTRIYKFSQALHKMYEKSGVKSPTKRVQINVFRHSLATERLNSGSSILEVKDLMRHDNVTTTMIYAKYNLPSLGNLATEWPEASS